MKTPVPSSRSYSSRSTARLTRGCSAIWFAILGLLLFGSRTYGGTNHPPTISWLPDQRIPSGTFTKKYFRISDKETPLTAASISVDSTNHAFTDPIGITWGICNTDDVVNHGCAADGGYWIAFPNPPGNTLDPSATVKVKVTDGTLDATSSFTLRQDSAQIHPS